MDDLIVEPQFYAIAGGMDAHSEHGLPRSRPARVANEVELTLDGVSLGRTAIGTERACFARCDTTFSPGALVATAYRDNEIAGQFEPHSTHRTYDGRLLAAIRPSGAGTVNVTVEAPGMEHVSLSFNAVPQPQ